MIGHSLVTGFTMFIRRSFDMTYFGISTYHRHEPPLPVRANERETDDTATDTAIDTATDTATDTTTTDGPFKTGLPCGSAWRGHLIGFLSHSFGRRSSAGASIES